MGSDSCLHKNHRKRLRDRYLKNGLNVFDDHVVLELLLFYALPRGDTNPLAHRLINRFGSLSAVFAASRDELMEVNGVGPAVATFLCCFSDSMRYISVDEMSGIPLNNVRRMGEYMRRWFAGRDSGCSAALLLDRDMKPLTVICLTERHGVGCSLFSEKIIEEASNAGSKTVVIAHTHPAGKTEPSADDLRSTRIIFDQCANAGISLAEHFIITFPEAVPILRLAVDDSKRGDIMRIYQ